MGVHPSIHGDVHSVYLLSIVNSQEQALLRTCHGARNNVVTLTDVVTVKLP